MNETNRQTQKFVATADMQLQTRLSRSIPDGLATAIREFCSQNRCISLCYVLDAMQQGDRKEWIFIATSIDRPEADADEIYELFARSLAGFPEIERIVFMSASSFSGVYAGREFYRRSN